MSISVALCTYNGQKYIQQQLDSIATQSLVPDELVICDDGSTDRTEEIVGEFAKSAPMRVRYFRNPHNLGATKNFEKAIGLCESNWIALSDQDDLWLPHKMETLAQVLRGKPQAGGVFSDAYLIDGDRNRLPSMLWAQLHYCPAGSQDTLAPEILLRHNVVTGATMMFRSELRSRLMPIASSWIHDGWIAWMIVLHSRLVPVCEPLMSYRLHASQQVGLPADKSVWARLTRARAAGSSAQMLLAKQFEDLRDFCAEVPNEEGSHLFSDFQRKIRHSRLRGTLPRNRLKRLLSIMGNISDYKRYSLGMITMAKDLLR